MIKNDFNYKWSKLFAAKRFDTDGIITLTPIEQQELLDDCDKLVKKLNIDDVSVCFTDQHIDEELIKRGVVQGVSELGMETWDEGKLHQARKMFRQGVMWAMKNER